MNFINLNALLISAICAGTNLSGQGMNACKKGTEATLIQTGISKDLKLVENYVGKQVDNHVTKPVVDFTGEEVWALAAIAKKLVDTGSVAYSFRPPIISDRIELSAGKNTAIILKWHF